MYQMNALPELKTKWHLEFPHVKQLYGRCRSIFEQSEIVNTLSNYTVSTMSPESFKSQLRY